MQLNEKSKKSGGRIPDHWLTTSRPLGTVSSFVSILGASN